MALLPGPAPSAGKGWGQEGPLSGGAVAAEQLVALGGGQAAAVLHEEAARAGELVLLLGQHADGQLLVRQVGAGELEVLVEVGLVDVDRRGLRLGAAGFELLERVLAELVGLVAARGVVVGGHGKCPSSGVLAGVHPARPTTAGKRRRAGRSRRRPAGPGPPGPVVPGPRGGGGG